MSGQSAPRRTVLKGAVLAGAAGLGVAACSTESKLGHAKPLPSTPVNLGTADAVPVGSAKLYREQRIIVSCPAEGKYTAFSAQCTHAGCVLDKIVEGEGNCPCHGSRFDVTTGEVLQGPATVPLPAIPVRAEGGELITGTGTGKDAGAASEGPNA
ncbi:FeS-binding protein [Streptomyces agglomeratus]|uniref:Cytochrome bc1 complex Rieske iron-sulfur subunit n=1 Tax=Streptomyces agglomeratus TaxID=285458 RepID=A0A1E5PD16_9ACTN|nr:Rieske (2Fe-2S) protein [Streptomyces agglomeratus]OEJ27416.1 FeS-binding protein [Streptomyces agglomeratus]OEJ38528.1 FeS-binding protein [Streptomyces agglomeratus]OEJ47088.1 FeS-binding protein [Streptomyces agglomeratus]OEJ51056.1 FeS-binding protein [Streptomyces agglomeratus]OEJ58426.1 FeS-binding protein [Streptomyces agglomeratus]